tara:strand:+ start:3655 stop:3819 length:165 start_codon:yes stop_codon:yes gene_type:complete
MNYTEFKTTANDLGYNLDEFTMMDAYAQYEITNCTVEAAVETIMIEEMDYNLNY